MEGVGLVTGTPSISITPPEARNRPAMHLSSGRLAAPGRPDDAYKLAGVHGEADVADRLDIPDVDS